MTPIFKKRRRRLAVVGIVGLPANYGGFETLVDHIIADLGSGCETTVYCSSKSYSVKPRVYKGARLRYLPFRANGGQSILYDAISLLESCWSSDVVLILGVSGCILLPFLRIFSPFTTFVTNLDGLEWKRAKWSLLVRAYLLASEWLACQLSNTVIADNEIIQGDILRRYKRRAVFIPYGADHVMKSAPDQRRLEKYGIRGPYLFKVARIEPENNIGMIVDAFRKGDLPFQLVIVGNWERSDYGREIRRSALGCENLLLLDPIYDQEELDHLRSNCHIYIHGHSAGGTNPSLIEAMMLGVPILAFDVAYNRATTRSKCYYFRNADELHGLVAKLTPDELSRLGAGLAVVAEEYYKWSTIKDQYSELLLAP